MFSFNTEALIAERMGPAAALWVAAGLCLVSVVANLIYFLMDRWAEPVLALGEKTAGDRIVWGDILKFRPSYWYIALLCLCFYSAIFPFTALSTNFFHEKWGLPLAMGAEEGFFAAVFQNFRHMFSTAPGTTSILVAMSMVFAPFAGALVDRIGRRTAMMVVGSALMVPCYLALAYTHLSPAMVMVVLGVAFVLVPAALWPSVPLIVSRRRLGTAFGVMTLIQNVGLMLFPWLNGWLRERTETYSASMLMFAGLGVAALAFALLLRTVDRHDGILERP
jgi:MFS family permease